MLSVLSADIENLQTVPKDEYLSRRLYGNSCNKIWKTPLTYIEPSKVGLWRELGFDNYNNNIWKVTLHYARTAILANSFVVRPFLRWHYTAHASGILHGNDTLLITYMSRKGCNHNAPPIQINFDKKHSTNVHVTGELQKADMYINILGAQNYCMHTT